MSLKEEKERAVTYQELRHAEGTLTGKAQTLGQTARDYRTRGREKETREDGREKVNAPTYRGLEKL